MTMIPNSRCWLTTLRMGLVLSAAGWGVSWYFALSNWETVVTQLQRMGADPIEYQPLLDYWLRMASAVFGCIGLASAAACVWPRTFESTIRLLAPFHLVMAGALIVAARGNELSVYRHPTFVPDIAFCSLTALLIGLPLLQGRRSAVATSAASP